MAHNDESHKALATREEMREAVGRVLNDFSRRVRQAHSHDEIDAHRDELADQINVVSSHRLNVEPHDQPFGPRMSHGSTT